MMRNSFVNVVQGIGASTTPIEEIHVDNTENVTAEPQIGVNLHHNANFIDNNSHPLYLHNNDHPGLVLIAKKLVDPDNFGP